MGRRAWARGGGKWTDPSGEEPWASGQRSPSCERGICHPQATVRLTARRLAARAPSWPDFAGLVPATGGSLPPPGPRSPLSVSPIEFRYQDYVIVGHNVSLHYWVWTVNQGRTGLAGRPQLTSRASLLGAEGQKGSPTSPGFERRKT